MKTNLGGSERPGAQINEAQENLTHLKTISKFFIFAIMNMLQVYILICTDNKYYVGVTNNVERRFFEHNNSDDTKSFTFSRRPVKLVWVSDEMPPMEAIEFEKQVKGWRREKKEALINKEYHKLPELSKNRQDGNTLDPPAPSTGSGRPGAHENESRGSERPHTQ
jgi:putative endonuclease